MDIHSSKTYRGYKAVPELLQRAGVDTVFGLLGGSNAPWVAAGVESGQFRFIRTRHEEATITAAAGYSRATGRLGVCTTTRGPGFTNSINALIAATRGSVPLLYITGEGKSTKAKPFGSSQEVDQEAFASIMGVGYHAVPDLNGLEDTFWLAARAALSTGRPQVLSLADRWFEQDVELSVATPQTLRPDTAPEDESVKAVIDELSAARSPLILAGWGAVMSDCRGALIELAELSGARLANTLRANFFFAGHERDLGLCGSWSPESVRRMINDADLVLSFGASLNRQTTESGAIFGGAKIVQCEIDDQSRFHASAPELFLLGDAGVAVGRLIDEWKRRGLATRPAPGPAPTREEIKAALLGVDLKHDPARGLDPRAAYVALDEVFPQDRIVVTDNGRFIATVPSLVAARDATSWIVGNAYGSVGLGLGAAIGAAAAHPDRPVLLITGDGGFAMAAQELDAIRLGGIDNLTVAIINDELYGSDVKYLRRFGLPNTVLYQPLPDIEALAKVYGGVGHVVTGIAQLGQIDFNTPGPTLLDIRVDPEVNVREAV
ncbi:thiamine pyrophosphate-binding protein [Aminobacter sp. AP02]|uniref:thiamine pyrophosphate-binding protein n=1 Tax=Aminobacter sp. AP02 TaxID=2135737 RepID=UPI000D78CED3|nr:thiamine pyrophosphate-binding protein [Aminobacter sp. AP02]PWK61291.1 thiamine pyrophosphate-dependent acetolactate synthase large subunit-like protein [Aminobacter sp. AP02]